MDLWFDEKNNIAYIGLSGILDKDSILDALESTISCEKYKDGMSRLWDFRDADLSELKSSDILSIAIKSSELSSTMNEVNIAIVVKDSLDYGLSRMFQSYTNRTSQNMVFRTVEEAEQWLMGVAS
ncbi:hypothetical protein [Geothermobacter hydrogeniphilus]|uniref:hypothetical protein n=1 Tax=Geothermobacter hydrogeniphilus TaxID=1969733 RepID=UPI0011AEE096|nr:hypothetical protein [Geothermobacter hydrogeniphilus]